MQLQPLGGLARLLLPFLMLVAAGAPAEAQKAKLGRKYYEDHHNGYRFRYPEEWLILPVKPGERDSGMTCKMDGPALITKVAEANQVGSYPVRSWVMRLAPANVEATTGEESAGLRGRVNRADGERTDVSKVVENLIHGLRDYDPKSPVTDKDIKGRKIKGNRRTFAAFNGYIDILIDTYTFTLSDADIALIYVIPDQHKKKWLSVFEKSAKTFELIERSAAVEAADSQDYEGMLAYHRDQASRTEGWRVLPTPSKRFIVKTSSDDDDFIEDVIERLEKSRDLFERDWETPEDFDHVSVVRICKTQEEFHKYGGTGGGVGGWFNPASTELVLFDYKNYNRAMTYAVMTHEAFHQFCHFLFEKSEAHRWFDDGHGDYYGGAEFKGRRTEFQKKMPGGFNRYFHAKELVKEGSFTPLEEHLNFSHGQWQKQGPRNVSSYCQSWSLIFMLRQGALGEVNKKVWLPEYSEILPNYVASLHAGFQEAFVEEAERRKKDAEEDGRTLAEGDLELTSYDLEDDVKKEIWAKAMEDSWGKIDLAQFEEHWKVFVDKYL